MSPYLVATVAFAESWLYENGVLCYIRDRQLRLLDLHRSATTEVVVAIRRLVNEAIHESRAKSRYRFRLLYYSHGLVSCLYTHSRSADASYHRWLVVLDSRAGQIVTVRPLESTSDLFVRNNGRFLYYGTSSGMGRDGCKRWSIRGFDITAREWLQQKLDIPIAMGSDVGSTVCFEIFDGYFYGISNTASLEVDEVDWVSYYLSFRFPLSRHGFRDVELPPREQFWRRNHAEGPIDDRWTFLRLFKDDTTGQLKLVESRKEWLAGRISARRTYYTTVISFDDPAIRQANGVGERFLHAQIEAPAVDPEKVRSGARLGAASRDPHMVHPGDDSSSFPYSLSKCPVRTYHPSTQTFMDLVNDTTSFEPDDQRIRLRGASRRLWTPDELERRNGQEMAQHLSDHDTLLQRVDNLYTSGSIELWPPDRQDPTVPDAALDDLYTVLNPPGHLGNPHGSWDERSLVYATGGVEGGLKALVFVSWDPTIYLAGTAPYPGAMSLGRPIGLTCGSPVAGRLATVSSYKDRGKAKYTTNWCPVSGPHATVCAGGSANPVRPSASASGTKASPAPWRTLEPAGYLDICRGYHFAY